MRMFVLLLALLCAATTAGAQLRDTTGIRAAITPFVEGDRIQLSARGTRWMGVFTRVDGDTLHFTSSQPAAVAVRLADVDTLWQWVNSAGKGPWIGAAIGAGIAGYAGMVWVGLIGAEGGSSNRVSEPMIVAGLLGATAGALTGSLIGGAIGRGGHRWKRIFSQ